LTPLYRDLSESELWFRYQPQDIVLVGIHREEMDVNGYRYCAASKTENFFDYFDNATQMESWLDRHDADYRPRWDARAS
jgi:hypothetical protein